MPFYTDEDGSSREEILSNITSNFLMNFLKLPQFPGNFEDHAEVGDPCIGMDELIKSPGVYRCADNFEWVLGDAACLSYDGTIVRDMREKPCSLSMLEWIYIESCHFCNS